MQIDLSQFRQLYLQESAEHLESMESSLLALRSDTGNADLLHSIFRAAHSIKGGAGSFGIVEVVRFTHTLEELLDRLRSFELPVTDELIDLLLETVDALRVYFQAGADGALSATAEELLQRLEPFSQLKASPSSPKPSQANAAPVPETRQIRIDFRPKPGIFSTGTNPILLLRNLLDLGDITNCELNSNQLPSLLELDPMLCYLSWQVDMTTTCQDSEIRELFEFVEDQAEIGIYNPAVDSTEQRSTESSLEAKKEDKESGKESSTSSAKNKPAEGGSMRVSTEKIDKLIDLVGELSITHSMASQMLDQFTMDKLPRLREAISNLERHTRELHERAMSVRMLPIGTLFQRYTRTVYDIGRSTGKQIHLQLHGEETEVDKSILERLGDPLTHLIRNAADHGLETEEERLTLGKDACGQITLKASHQGGKVVIEISDDGRGMNPEKIRKKALQCGLIQPETILTPEQTLELIFEPGFSTCDSVSNLSGRGVGMDVVRRNVQSLNGSISIDSVLGKGSKIRISLPLTLAILEGLLVRVGDRTLVLPLLSVLESVSPSAESIINLAGAGEVVLLREEPIPLLRMKRFLGILDNATSTADSLSSTLRSDHEGPANADTVRSLVVIVEHGSKKFALFIDDLLGQQQVVIKPLERHFKKIDGIMGATILGDGCVAPIIDVAGLASPSLFAHNAGEQIINRNPLKA